MCTEIFLARLTGPVICGVTTPRIRWITRNSVSRSRVPLQNLHARVTKLPRARNQECDSSTMLTRYTECVCDLISFS